MLSEKGRLSLRFSCPGLCWPDAETRGQKVCLQRIATHRVVQPAGRQAGRQTDRHNHSVLYCSCFYHYVSYLFLGEVVVPRLQQGGAVGQRGR